MQLKILLKKDISSLFKQKSVIGTLFIPAIVIILFGLLPGIIGIEEPFEVVYLNEDEGITDLNLGDKVLIEMNKFFEENENFELREVTTFKSFINSEDGFWLPANFTKAANTTNFAQYFMKVSDTNIRSESTMFGVVAAIIETVVTEELLAPTQLPVVQPSIVYSPADIFDDGERKDRGAIAFPLAYMAFLILILTGSSIRVSGFAAEKGEGMMELILASVKYRRELILSKLVTGLLYGFASVMSYIIGLAIVEIGTPKDGGGSDFSEVFVPRGIFTPKNLLILIALFMVLTFLSMQIMLATQLLLGKDAGERLGSMINFVLAFLFYFGAFGDPLAEDATRLGNPFYWPFRIAINLIFIEDGIKTFLYTITTVAFSAILLKVKTYAIEKEKVIYE